GGKPSHKQRIRTFSVAITRIGIDEVWLNQDLISRYSPFDELATCEGGQSQIIVDHPGPRAQKPVRCEHCSHEGTVGPGLAVATVAHALPHAFFQAFFTDPPIAE